MVALGVDPKKIIYAQPVKFESSISYAKSVGVELMTFDNVSELHKIKNIYPEAHLVLRYRRSLIIYDFALFTYETYIRITH